MTDRVRSALFSSLGNLVDEARVLDLYSGSGSLGIEGLSRGAAHTSFVERDPSAVATIEDNLELTGFRDRAEIVTLPVEHFLARRPNAPFDVVFVDPPFSLGLPSGVLTALFEGGFLSDEAVVVVQISSRNAGVDLPVPFELVSQRRYGDSILLYLTVTRSSST